MSERFFVRAAELLTKHIGLRADATMRIRIDRAVSDEAARLGLSLSEYIDTLDRDPARRQDLFDRVTVQETTFFRDTRLFQALVDVILPDLIAEGDRVRVWSAGCANGQEAYSLAMVLEESGVPDWHIVATDISSPALERTRRGTYVTAEMAGVSSARQTRHFLPYSREDSSGTADASRRPVGHHPDEPMEWTVRESLRTRVEVRRHNLVTDPLPFDHDECNLVLCRNVLIYLQRVEAVDLLERLSDHLQVGAYLLLGYSESLLGITDRFELTHVGNAFAYRNVGRQPGVLTSAPEQDTAASSPRGRQFSHLPLSPATAGGFTSPPVDQVIQRQAADEFAADGAAAMADGDPAAAVRSFRKAVYVDPDEEGHHHGLAGAFAASGDDPAAARASAAGQAARARRHNLKEPPSRDST